MLLFAILLFAIIAVTKAYNSCPNKYPPTGAILNGSELNWLVSKNQEIDEDDVPRTKLATDPNLIKFLYYTAPDKSVELKVGDTKLLDASKFVKDIPLKVLTHGFLSDANSDFPKLTKNAFLQSHNEKFNILVVDWGALSGSLPHQYNGAVSNVYVVANQLANLLTFMVHEEALRFNDVHLIGFSLGAHISGVAGHNIYTKNSMKLGRITGLDPAGPSFGVGLKDKTRKLDMEDAQFVDVIHTNAGILGTEEPSGLVDFYPNGGGSRQPGCFLPTCSHSFAHKLYTELVAMPTKHTACKCEPWNWNEKGECRTDCKDGVHVGLNTPTTPVLQLNGGALREVYIKNSASGRCLTAEASGEYLDIYDCVNAKHQQWLFVGSETWQGKFSDSCFSDDDCLSANCTYGNCQLGFLKNGCRDKDDCSTTLCESGFCDCATGGTSCDNDQQCCSEACVQHAAGGVCSCVGTNAPWFGGFSCCSGLCSSDACKCKSCNKNGFPGHSVGVECCSGKCTDSGVCAKKQPGQPCTTPKECETGLCSNIPGYERFCLATSFVTNACSTSAECETRLGTEASCEKSKFPVKCQNAQGNDQDGSRTTDPESNSACCSNKCYPKGPPFWKRNPFKKSSYQPQCV